MATIDDGTIILEIDNVPETIFVMGEDESVFIEVDAETAIEVYETFPLPSYVLDIKTYRDDTEAFMLAAQERWKGAYNPLAAYTALDIVSYNGSSYIATDNISAGVTPGTGAWSMLAEKGDTGDDGWAVPIQRITHYGTGLEIDYQAGKTVHLIVEGDTQLSFVGWPPNNYLARLTLLIENTGGHVVSFPAGIKWGSGEPMASAGDDWYAITTVDGGLTQYGHVIGQDYH